jgi:hypothetical protein
MVTLFAVGAITGTILSFEMGLLWPGFTATVRVGVRARVRHRGVLVLRRDIYLTYPTAFGSIASTLSVPLVIGAVGIIVRGATYALRAGARELAEERASFDGMCPAGGTVRSDEPRSGPRRRQFRRTVRWPAL